MVLIVGGLVRLPLVPRLGHGYDQTAYRQWMGAIQEYGLAEVFTRTDTDYVGYHYILWALAKGYGKPASQTTVRDKALRVWLKLPGLVGDALVTVLVAAVARSVARRRSWLPNVRLARLGRRLRLTDAELAGLVAAALVAFHPAMIYASGYWGQSDSLVAGAMLAACLLGWRGLPGWAGAVLALGVMVKPQPLVVGPLLAWIVWRRCGWRGLVRGGLAGLAVLVVGHAYFVATGNTGRVLEIYAFQLTQTEHLSFGAYNLWWPFERLLGAHPNTAILSAGGASLTYGRVASALVLALLVWSLRALRHADDAGILTAVGIFLAGYYLVAAGSHERYALPALVFLLPAVLTAPRLRWPLLLFSVTVCVNLLVGLPLDRRWPTGHPEWLTLATSVAATASVAWLLREVQSSKFKV